MIDEMSTVKKLQGLDVWVNSRSLVRSIYSVTASASWKHDFNFVNQLRSASVSTMSNIAEGYGRSSTREFARFLDIARGSAFEVQSLVCIGTDVGYLDQKTADQLLETADHIVAQITSFKRYLRNR